MQLPKFVKLVEVSPRDGFQNETTAIPTQMKVDFINHLADTGLATIEVTSFVSPKKIPQLADHQQLYQSIKKKPGVHYPVLIPNLHGMQTAVKVGVEDIAIFTAVSETFTQKNINCSITESLNRIEQVIKIAKENNIRVRGYISCVLGCPYEGDIEFYKVADLTQTLYQLGCYEVSLGDTIGVGTPLKTSVMLETVLAKNIPLSALAVHFHDTYGQALANIYASLQLGIQTIDASVAGLGGCPYAKGATGNVASEDVVYMLHGLGIATGIDLEKLVHCGNSISHYLKRPSRSKVALAFGN